MNGTIAVTSNDEEKVNSFLVQLGVSQENIKMWQLILESFVLQQMERERDILTSSPMERYNRVLKRSPLLFQEIPNKYIASYLGVTPESFSRIRKKIRHKKN